MDREARGCRDGIVKLPSGAREETEHHHEHYAAAFDSAISHHAIIASERSTR
jgi:hypothetical protein